IQEIEGMITEFKRHHIKPIDLEQQLEPISSNIPLANKIDDLQYIYAQLMNQLENKYIDGEDQLTMLSEKIVDTPLFQDAEIYIDGFYRFTPKELSIISELLKVAKSVNVALTVDLTIENTEQSELDLFFQTSETYETLQQIAE